MSPKSDKPETGETETVTVKVPETQEPPKTATVEELQAENARLEKALKERNQEEAARRKKLEALEAKEIERENAAKSELQKAQERADVAERKARAAELSVMRRDAAVKVKLPPEFADRIKGETPEEMEADAAIMLAAMPKPVAPKLEPTNPGQPQTGETDAERRKRLGL
jgi:chromosome segregation ATPase